MNHLELLKKYMKLVYDSEAVTFVGWTTGYEFSDEELALLKDIARELGSDEDGL